MFTKWICKFKNIAIYDFFVISKLFIAGGIEQIEVSDSMDVVRCCPETCSLPYGSSVITLVI